MTGRLKLHSALRRDRITSYNVCYTKLLRAKRLNAQSPLALRTVKRVLNTVHDTSQEVGLELEGHAFEKLRDSHDYHEGANAFFEKRTPTYKGE